LFFFETNQRVDVRSSPITFSTSDPAWSFVTSLGYSQSAYLVAAQPNVATAGNTSAVTAGDAATMSIVVDALATGEQGVTISGTVTLTTAVDPGLDTPAIEELLFGPLSSSAPSLVKVRFEAARPVADSVEIGGWKNYPRTVGVNDLGQGADDFACDGWYTGTVTLAPGSYDVLARARNTETTRVGPFLRKAVVVF